MLTIRNFHLKALHSLRTYSTKTIAKVLTSGNLGDTIEIKGWVHSVRAYKRHVFVDLTDGSCIEKLQIVISKQILPEHLYVGCSVCVTGPVTQTSKGQTEIPAESIHVIGECHMDHGYPFVPSKIYEPEYCRQHLHFRPRLHSFAALLRLRSTAQWAVHSFFRQLNFTQIDTPILTSNDCEGAGETFYAVPDNKETLEAMKVKSERPSDEVYFDGKTFLTVSGQLHLEAVAHGLVKVYTLGPTFRAENSKSRLHLSEFYMLEAEVAFINDLEDVLNLVENLLKTVTRVLLNEAMQDLQKCANDSEDNNKSEFSVDWIDKEFPIITYEEATRIAGGTFCTKQDELNLAEHFQDVPTFVINWPKHSKPFYMRTCEDNKNNVAAFDLIVPNVGELVGGGLRENHYETLKANLPADHKLEWYLDLRKYGGVPTGGFGLGFERFLQFLINTGNIKDTIPFPRWPHHCYL